MSWLRGSTPTTRPSATRRYMPHWTPQKQQWVGTSRPPTTAVGSAPAPPRPPWPSRGRPPRPRRRRGSRRRRGPPPGSGPRSPEPPLDGLQVGLAALDPLAARAGLGPLREAELQLVHGLLEVVHERPGLQGLAAGPAGGGPGALQGRPLVDLDPDAGRALDDVEELAEGDEHQRQHHRGHVGDGQEVVAAALHEPAGEGEQQAGHRDRDQADQGEEVVAEALAGGGLAVAEAPPQEPAAAGQHQHGGDVEAVEHHPAQERQGVEADRPEPEHLDGVAGTGALSEKKASQPKVSGKVIKVASTTPQNSSGWASQRPRPRARRNVWKPR